VFVEQVMDDRTHEAELDGKLIKLGSEREMSDMIATQLDRIEPGLMLVRREAPTPVGPIDILATDSESAPVVIEVKRQPGVSMESCYQLLRYIEAVQTMEEWKGCTPRGILVAPGLRKGVKEFLDQRGLAYVRIGYDDLKEQPARKPKRRASRKKGSTSGFGS
jgi:RecB family endonuclease NucS